MTEAVIFDLDGLLIDSEPLWRVVEMRVFGALGVPLTEERCRATMGMSVDDVVAHWYALMPWVEPEPDSVRESIVQGVIEVIAQSGTMMPGVGHALDLVARLGLRRAVASSSYESVIGAALDRLGLDGVFDIVVSAEHEERGKPFPDVYLTAAHNLGVAPASCVAIEDSPAGIGAAKAAGMRCIAVPDAGTDHGLLAEADTTLRSLEDLDASHLLW